MDILLRFFTWDWRNTFATLQRDQVANLLAILRYDRDLALPCDGSICSARHRSAQAGILKPSRTLFVARFLNLEIPRGASH